MRPERQELYNRLASTIGKTPLTELHSIEIPNNNKILAKEEYRNPTGSHYDRIILALLQGLERQGEFHFGKLDVLGPYRYDDRELGGLVCLAVSGPEIPMRGHHPSRHAGGPYRPD